MVSDELKSQPAPEPGDTVRNAVLAAAREHQPTPLHRAGRRLRSWMVAVPGLALIAGLVLFFTLRPTPAHAALDRVIAASGQVKSCHMRWVVEQQNADPPVTEVNEQWYQDGKLRMERTRDGQLVDVQVYDGKKLHTYDAAKNTIHLNVSDRPFGTEFKGFTVAAMLEDMRDAEVEQDTAPDGSGRTMNRFTITRPGRERAVVLADPGTDLPVSFTGYAWDGSDWKLAGRSEVTEYNQPVDPSRFLLTHPTDAVIIDDEQAQRTLAQSNIGHGKYGDYEIVVHDLQVIGSGEVYVVWSGIRTQAEMSLRDSNGTDYVDQGSVSQALNSFSAVWFIPVVEGRPAPTWYDFTVSHQGRNPRTVTIRVTDVRRTSGPEPAYLVRGYNFPEGARHRYTRALQLTWYWDGKNDAGGTLTYLNQCVALWESDKELQDWPLPEQWESNGDLYQKLGCRDQARKAYERALQELDRAAKNPSMQYVDGVLEQTRSRIQADLQRLK